MTEAKELTATEEMINSFKEEEQRLVGSMIESARRRVENGWNKSIIISNGNPDGTVSVHIPTHGLSSYCYDTDQFYKVLEENYGYLNGIIVGEGRFSLRTARQAILHKGAGVNRRHHTAEAYFPVYIFYDPSVKKRAVLKMERSYFDKQETWSVVASEVASEFLKQEGIIN